jgi:hypothetical protein
LLLRGDAPEPELLPVRVAGQLPRRGLRLQDGLLHVLNAHVAMSIDLLVELLQSRCASRFPGRLFLRAELLPVRFFGLEALLALPFRVRRPRLRIGGLGGSILESRDLVPGRMVEVGLGEVARFPMTCVLQFC